jgi:cell division transport system permease protein
MIFISFFRTLKYAFQDFFRNFWLSVATVGILVLTLLSINVLFAFHYLSSSAIRAVESTLDITLFFKPEFGDAQIIAIQNELSALPEVDDVVFLSREERVQKFQEQYADEPEILEAFQEIDENPFGAGLIIRAKESKDYAVIIKALDDDRYNSLIEEKDYKDQEAVVQQIAALSQKVKQTVQVMSIVFGMIALLIVFNTIRVAIYTHREEISIMKAVGATNLFVRLPYVIVSIFYSIFACGITFGLWFGFLRYANPYLVNFFGEGMSLLQYFSENFFLIFGTQLAATIVLNMVSSMFAIGRYLRA